MRENLLKPEMPEQYSASTQCWVGQIILLWNKVSSAQLSAFENKAQCFVVRHYAAVHADSLILSFRKPLFRCREMKIIVEHWKNDFDWRKQEAILNSFPQFKTTIEGLEVHFLRVKPPSGRKGKVQSLRVRYHSC